ASGWARSAATSCATMVGTSSLPAVPMVVLIAPSAGWRASRRRHGPGVQCAGGAWRAPRAREFGVLRSKKRPAGAAQAAPGGMVARLAQRLRGKAVWLERPEDRPGGQDAAGPIACGESAGAAWAAPTWTISAAG